VKFVRVGIPNAQRGAVVCQKAAIRHQLVARVGEVWVRPCTLARSLVVTFCLFRCRSVGSVVITVPLLARVNGTPKHFMRRERTTAQGEKPLLKGDCQLA
jgi:hypothetical protein